MTDTLNDLTSVFAWHNIAAQLKIEQTAPDSCWEDANTIIGLFNKFTDTQDEKYLDSIAALSPAFVENSTKAVGFNDVADFEREARLSMTKGDYIYANPPASFAPSEDRIERIQQALAICRFWLGLKQAMEAAEKQAEKLGLTVEAFAAMDLRDRDVAYTKWRKSQTLTV
jgi:hypothetical protein